ncbi:MAG: CRISPR-associated endonuclease Cas2 [Cyanobacteriota bacterium]|nr:CRISPR-associated endonuclease Cas2 [Cyanobacteriota bacterium]
MQLYVVAYDIPNDKRRKKVSDLLEGYGQRVQYSVFECLLEPDQYKDLQRRLQTRLDLVEDQVRFYPLSAHTLSRVEAWGGPDLLSSPISIVV